MSLEFDPHLAGNALANAAVLAAVVLARHLLVSRLARRADWSESRRRLFAMRVRVACGFVLVAASAVIWLAEIQSLLWSLTAIAAALVIATKELIQCSTGALLRAAGGSFRVGDTIEIDGTHGRIVAHGILTTTIVETEKGSGGTRPTGRRVVFPNSRLFVADLRVDDVAAPLMPLSFHIVFDPVVSTQQTVDFLEATLARYCEPFAGMRRAAEGAGPLVTLETTELGRVRLDVSCFVPPKEAVAFEREVKMEVLEWLWSQAQARQSRSNTGARFTAVNDRPARAA